MAEHKDILREFEGLATSAAGSDALMKQICDRLHELMPRYNWVGFYRIDKTNLNVLSVGAHTGSFSPNASIPLDRGLCGAAATSGTTIVVNDVSKDPRYLSGSDLVKAEVVVPMFVGKKLVGELDVESYFLGTFTPKEQEFVEACAAIVTRYMERNPGK